MTTLRMKLVALSIAAAIGLHAHDALAASNSTSDLLGNVTAAGEAKAGLRVQIRNTATNFTQSFVTDAAGRYRFTQLPTGEYEVSVFRDDKLVARETVALVLGQAMSLPFALSADTDAERIAVVGARPSAIDLSRADSGMIMSEAEIDRLPVNRTATDIALLAPGTLKGDSSFGNLASFSGATVGENSYFLNGLNLTNFRNGLGFNTPPFEFFKEVQVKTGGLSAEFGRFTGGVINLVSKSGTNEWEFGVDYYPGGDDFRAGPHKQLYYTDGPSKGLPRMFSSGRDSDSNWVANLKAAGPLIRDKVFAYVLLTPNVSESETWTQSARVNAKSENLYWATKIDWFINEEHRVELTAYSNEYTTESRTHDYKRVNNSPVLFETDPNAFIRLTDAEGGGTNYILSYVGNLGDDLTVRAAVGHTESQFNAVSPTDHLPAVNVAYRQAGYPGRVLTQTHQSGFSESADERDVARVDFAWYGLEDHKLKAGIDNETLLSFQHTDRSGGASWTYYFMNPNDTTLDYAQKLEYRILGHFETKADAFYLEDEWQVTPGLMVMLGLRHEQFNNYNVNGESFAAMDKQWAPRLAATWDVNGDGSAKVYFTMGRYHLPIVNNTNVRLAGNELYRFTNYYNDPALYQSRCGKPKTQDQVTYNPNGAPTVNEASCRIVEYANGTPQDPLQIVDQEDFDPMYQDEFILGYQFKIDDHWSANIYGVYRDLKSTIEDMSIPKAPLAEWAKRNNITPGAGGIAHTYILGNPGTDLTFYWDFQDGQGRRRVTLTREELGYPESVRKYKAVNFVLDRKWDDVWSASFSYVWSHSYGNNEGFVRSDNGQSDAGLTTLFDFPESLIGAYGDLPNDRRHYLKLYGAYAVTDDLVISANASAATGRPKNCFGVWPEVDEGPENWGYGAAYFRCDGQPTQRGDRGRTPNQYTLQIAAGYELPEFIPGLESQVKLAISNPFNWDRTLQVGEYYETNNLGDRNWNYGLPTVRMAPRSVALSLHAEF